MSDPAASPRYQRLADHLGTAVTLSYLALVAIGMFHSVLDYRHFGINILDYAEASDFLLAPFRDPMVMVVTVLPAVLAWAYLRSVDRYSTRVRARRRAAGEVRAVTPRWRGSSRCNRSLPPAWRWSGSSRVRIRTSANSQSRRCAVKGRTWWSN
jgi:hypothetical protein